MIIAVAVAWAVIQWLRLFTAPSAVTAYREAIASGTPAQEVVTTYDFLGLLCFFAAISAFLLTGIWLDRARRNADRIAPAQQRRSRIWVWLGWVVPIVVLWFPKQVIDDVWRSTVHHPVQPTTGWWWGSWIAFQVFGNFSVQIFSATDESREGLLDNVIIFEMLTTLAMTIAVLGWIRVVRTISTAQDVLADGAPPPTRV